MTSEESRTKPLDHCENGHLNFLDASEVREDVLHKTKLETLDKRDDDSTTTHVQLPRFCEHQQRSNRCRMCNIDGGGEICVHSRRRRQCMQCDPENCYAGKYRNWLKRALRKASTASERKSKHLHLTYSFECLKMHIQTKIDAYNLPLLQLERATNMTFDNIVLDHIKPVFACIRDGDARDTTNHYTNIQPLFHADNKRKSHHWSSDDQDYWTNNIIFKPAFSAIYMPVVATPSSA